MLRRGTEINFRQTEIENGSAYSLMKTTFKQSRSSTVNCLKPLYDVLIGPIADLLQGHDLIFVPDGPFCLAPFSALSDTARIPTVPSLTALKLITSAPIDFNSKSEVLLVGDPWLKKATWPLGKPIYEQLPYAKEMVELIGKLLQTEAFTCRNATEAQGGDRQFSCLQLSYLNMHSEC